MPDAPHEDLHAVRSAAERFASAASAPEAPEPTRSAVERALPPVLGTLLGGSVLGLLGGLTGVLSLGFGAVVVALGLAAASGYVLLALGDREERREARAAAARREARAEQRTARTQLLHAVGGAVAHVEQLDAERAQLGAKVDRLERRLAAKDRKLARLQAFDAERRTLEPAPLEEPMAGQLTFDAVS